MARKVKNVRISDIIRDHETVTAKIAVDFIPSDGLAYGDSLGALVSFPYHQSDGLEIIEKKALGLFLLLLNDSKDFSADELHEAYLNPIENEYEVDLSGLGGLTTQ